MFHVKQWTGLRPMLRLSKNGRSGSILFLLQPFLISGAAISGIRRSWHHWSQPAPAALCDVECHLVESDQKKAIFLQTVVRECGIPATIHTARIEELPSLQADIVTARALAPMDRLLDFLADQLAPGTRCLFLKGAQAKQELAALGPRPDLSWQLTPSLTNPDAFVVDLTVSS